MPVRRRRREEEDDEEVIDSEDDEEEEDDDDEEDDEGFVRRIVSSELDSWLERNDGQRSSRRKRAPSETPKSGKRRNESDAKRTATRTRMQEPEPAKKRPRRNLSFLFGSQRKSG